MDNEWEVFEKYKLDFTALHKHCKDKNQSCCAGACCNYRCINCFKPLPLYLKMQLILLNGQ